MKSIDTTDPLVMLVLGFIGRDIVPWVGARLVELAKWAGPRVDRTLDACLLVITTRMARQPKETPQAPAKKDTDDTAPDSATISDKSALESKGQ